MTETDDASPTTLRWRTSRDVTARAVSASQEDSERVAGGRKLGRRWRRASISEGMHRKSPAKVVQSTELGDEFGTHRARKSKHGKRAKKQRKAEAEKESESQAEGSQSNLETEKANGVKGAPLGRKQFETLREIFRDYDQDRRGFISRTSFRCSVGRLQPNLADFSNAMFDAADKNHNEEIDLIEFLQMYVPHLSHKHAHGLIRKYGGALYKEDRLEARRKRAQADEEKAQHIAKESAFKSMEGEIGVAFDQWCTAGKTSISFHTLRRRCPAIDPYVIGSWFHQHDKDQNGRLTKDEFVVLFQQHYGGPGKDHMQHLARTLHSFNEKALAKANKTTAA